MAVGPGARGLVIFVPTWDEGLILIPLLSKVELLLWGLLQKFCSPNVDTVAYSPFSGIL